MTFEQYVMERQRQFAGDPDAQAWFSGFGAGAYGPAPDDFRVVNLLDRVLNTDISLPYGSGTRPAEAQEYRNQGVTPLSISVARLVVDLAESRSGCRYRRWRGTGYRVGFAER